MENDYLECLVRTVVPLYQDAFKKHGNSPWAILDPKGRMNLRFERLIAPVMKNGLSVLDYGCGLADLRKYLEKKYDDFNYFGVDIVEQFIFENIKNYGKETFSLIKSYREIVGEFDLIAISGVFNLLYSTNTEEHKEIVQNSLCYLFHRARIALSVNFMTDKVDYQQPGAYHQNVIEIYEFVTKRLSPRVILDQSYMPYEFTLIIFRDHEIVCPENCYRSL